MWINRIHLIDCASLLWNSTVPRDELFKVEIDTHPSPIAHLKIGIRLAEELKSMLPKKTTGND